MAKNLIDSTASPSRTEPLTTALPGNALSLVEGPTRPPPLHIDLHDNFPRWLQLNSDQLPPAMPPAPAGLGGLSPLGGGSAGIWPPSEQPAAAAGLELPDFLYARSAPGPVWDAGLDATEAAVVVAAAALPPHPPQSSSPSAAAGLEPPDYIYAGGARGQGWDAAAAAADLMAWADDDWDAAWPGNVRHGPEDASAAPPQCGPVGRPDAAMAPLSGGGGGGSLGGRFLPQRHSPQAGLAAAPPLPCGGEGGGGAAREALAAHCAREGRGMAAGGAAWTWWDVGRGPWGELGDLDAGPAWLDGVLVV